MSEITSAPTSGENAAPISPGQLLQTARLANEVSLQDIADALNLPVEKIEALERDDYDGFSGRTYVRGYLLGYARYLRIDIDAIDRAFSTIFAANQVPEFNFKSLEAKSASGLSVNCLFAGLLVILVIVAAVATYFIRSAITDDAEDGSVIPSAAAALQSRAGAFDPDMGPSQVLVNKASSPAPRLVSQLATPTLAGLAISSASAAQTSANSAPEHSLPVNSEIVLKFGDQCWADVRANDGSKLLYNLQPANSVVMLSASPPLQVFLGNAAAVTISYNGQPYEYPVRGRIAQFTLKAPAHANPISVQPTSIN